MTRGRRSKQGKVTFRSGLEETVASLLEASLLSWKHESITLNYTVPQEVHRYTPDFTLEEWPNLILEAKGIFSSADRKKMLFVQTQHPDKTIVMLFGRAHAFIRKGSKTTNAAWCDKQGIKWIDLKDFKENPSKCLSNIMKKKRLGRSSPQRTRNNVRSMKLGK